MKTLLAFSLVAILAGCASKPPVVVCETGHTHVNHQVMTATDSATQVKSIDKEVVTTECVQ